MTIRIQPSGTADFLLGLLNKRRAVILPDSDGNRPYGNTLARREGFFEALLRPASAPLPKGYFYPEDLESGRREPF
jgi:hypothetical protein